MVMHILNKKQSFSCLASTFTVLSLAAFVTVLLDAGGSCFQLETKLRPWVIQYQKESRHSPWNAVEHLAAVLGR